MSSVNATTGFSSNKTAFGEILLAQLEPKIYGQFAYNINPELFKDNSTGSGSLSVSDSFCTISSGTDSNGVGKLTSIAVLEYHPGVGGLVRFTAIFSPPVAGNMQLVGIGDNFNGFFIGYNGTELSVCRRYNGVNNFIARDDFSEDKLDGTGFSSMTIDTTKGNVFQIQYQWLGFGEIRFFVENPLTGEVFIFHRIQYANANTLVSVKNPTLPFQAESTNITNETDIVIKVPSLGAYNEGLDADTTFLTHAANNTKDSITTETSIISIRNNVTYAGTQNYVRISPRIITGSAQGTSPVSISCYKNTVLGGVPNFVDFNSASSPVSIDVAGTTITGGIKISAFSVSSTGSNILNLFDVPIFLAPGDIFTIGASSSAATEVAISITWVERFG